MQQKLEPEIVTERLYLQPPAITDLEFFTRLYANREVMQHIPPHGEAASAKEAEERLRRLIVHWLGHVYGMFVAEMTGSGEAVGYCRFRFLHEISKIVLGYIIDQPFWGSSITSEAVGACVHYARDTLQTDCLVSVTSPNNLASRRILTRLGFARIPEKDCIFHGMHHIFLYRNSSGRVNTDMQQAQLRTTPVTI